VKREIVSESRIGIVHPTIWWTYLFLTATIKRCARKLTQQGEKDLAHSKNLANANQCPLGVIKVTIEAQTKKVTRDIW
jgi:hypothetical protein